MKSILDKFFSKQLRLDFLLLVVPFIFWVFCFQNFFNGHINLEADAISYADHIVFYINNISKGIFPLWDPTGAAAGAPNDFFLRRFGDFNPFLFLLIFFKWINISSTSAYLILLGVYYFLAGWAFYLIARFLFVDRFFAFNAYILFLFSSWGSEIFYNYIIILFLPIIWFFYFLLCFFRSPQKSCLLGMCLCVGLILTTYIPFFFLTILVLFTTFFVIFYNSFFVDLLKKFLFFSKRNKFFVAFCVFFILVSCIPGLAFYKESKAGEFVLPGRHLGSTTTSAVGVGLENVASGDIISHGYFDRLFDEHADIDLGDIYLPCIFFLFLFCSVGARVDRLIFFLLFNILATSLITITSASGVHRFLFDHIIFFKFIRNIYYFFWLSILPMVILLSVEAFKSLLSTINISTKKTSWFVYILACHLIFVLFLSTHHGVLLGAWAAVVISLIYFLIYFRCESKFSYWCGFCLFLLAVFIQSAQVYGYLGHKVSQGQKSADIVRHDEHHNAVRSRIDLYYASKWFAILNDYIDPKVFSDYKYHQFLLYDNVMQYEDSSDFLNTFQKAIAANANIAFVSKFESLPEDARRNGDTNIQAESDPVSLGKLSILYNDTNTWKIRAHLSNRQFLVINDGYNTDWHAFIDGRPARLLRANVAFKGLWVPSGDSTILLRFATPRRYLFHFCFIALFAGVFIYLLLLLSKNKQTEIYA